MVQETSSCICSRQLASKVMATKEARWKIVGIITMIASLISKLVNCNWIFKMMKLHPLEKILDKKASKTLSLTNSHFKTNRTHLLFHPLKMPFSFWTTVLANLIIRWWKILVCSTSKGLGYLLKSDRKLFQLLVAFQLIKYIRPLQALLLLLF